MIEKVKKALAKIKDTELYSPEDILKMGVIVNSKLEPSHFTLYRLIRNGKLKAVNMSTGSSSRHVRYFVKGAELKSYLKLTYSV